MSPSAFSFRYSTSCREVGQGQGSSLPQDPKQPPHHEVDVQLTCQSVSNLVPSGIQYLPALSWLMR